MKGKSKKKPSAWCGSGSNPRPRDGKVSALPPRSWFTFLGLFEALFRTRVGD